MMSHTTADYAGNGPSMPTVAFSDMYAVAVAPGHLQRTLRHAVEAGQKHVIIYLSPGEYECSEPIPPRGIQTLVLCAQSMSSLAVTMTDTPVLSMSVDDSTRPPSDPHALGLPSPVPVLRGVKGGSTIYARPNTWVTLIGIHIYSPSDSDSKCIKATQAVVRVHACRVQCVSGGSDRGPYPRVFACALLGHGQGCHLGVSNSYVTAVQGQGRGVVAMKGAHVSIVKCFIGPCDQSGVTATDINTRVMTHGTTLHQTSGYGAFYTLKGAVTTLHQSHILNSGHYGVMCLHDHSYCTVTQCKIQGSHWQAISVRWGGGGRFTDNNLYDNRLGPWGIRLSCAGSVQRQGNVPRVDALWCEKWTAPDLSTHAQPSLDSGNGGMSNDSKHASSLAPEPLRTAVGTTGYPQRGVSKQHAVDMVSQLEMT